MGQVERIARAHIAIGSLDRTELYKILQRLHQARAERTRADSQYRIARARLARLTGFDREHVSGLSLARLQAAAPVTLEETLSQAASMSQTLAQARQRLEVAEGELAFRKADLWPTLNLEVNANTRKVGNLTTTDFVGNLGLVMPLYEGGVRRSRLRNARLAVETARQELLVEQERVAIEVRTTWNQLESLNKVLLSFQSAVVDSEKVVKLTRSKLDAGHATFVEYIEAQQSVLGATFMLLDNRLRLETTRINLLQALAILHP